MSQGPFALQSAKELNKVVNSCWCGGARLCFGPWEAVTALEGSLSHTMRTCLKNCKGNAEVQQPIS